MDYFLSTSNQMLVIFLFMLIGYLLRRKNIVEENAYANLSKMELFIFTPALTFSTQMRQCTPTNLKENVVLILIGAVLMVVAIVIAGPLSGLIVRNHKMNREAAYERNIYKYATALANYGFVGNFIILSVFGETGLFKYQMFDFFMTVCTYSWGMYVLIPKDRNAGMLKNIAKGLTSPPMIAVVLGMVCGLLGWGEKIDSIPFVKTILDNASLCMGPVAMLLAGMVLGNYPLKDMFKEKRVYIVSLFRLIIIPSAFLVALKLILPLINVNVDSMVIPLTLVAFGAPLGLNTIVFPAAYGGNPKIGASMALISSLFCVITLPMLYYIFVVFWH